MSIVSVFKKIAHASAARIKKTLHAFSPATVDAPPVHLLIDVGTGAVLTATPFVSITNFLTSCVRDTNQATANDHPYYSTSDFAVSIAPNEYPQWTWSHKSRSFSRIRSDILTEELRARARLACAKRDAIGRIIYNINRTRQQALSGIILQSEIYFDKKMQAQTFKSLDYDESRLMQFPYVLQYADFKHISPRQATDEIILKAKMSDEHLSKTELLRMRYFEKIATAASPDDMPGIIADFIKDCYVNAQV